MHEIMTRSELAKELAELEGVGEIFDLTVKRIIDERRRVVMRQLLKSAEMGPSEVVEHAETLESALRKVDHNIRCQYEDFLAAYIESRATAFTAEEMQTFIIALRAQSVRDYLQANRRSNSAFYESLSPVLDRIVSQAIRGADINP